MAKSILIIDPFKNVINIYRMILEEKGFAVSTAADLDQVPQNKSLETYSIIITEFFFPLEKTFTPSTFSFPNISVGNEL
jgi:DNA-binding NtrC family response regulator